MSFRTGTILGNGFILWTCGIHATPKVLHLAMLTGEESLGVVCLRN